MHALNDDKLNCIFFLCYAGSFMRFFPLPFPNPEKPKKSFLFCRQSFTVRMYVGAEEKGLGKGLNRKTVFMYAETVGVGSRTEKNPKSKRQLLVNYNLNKNYIHTHVYFIRFYVKMNHKNTLNFF